MRRIKPIGTYIATSLAVRLPSASPLAQADGAALFGTTPDATSAFLPGPVVTAIQSDGGLQRTGENPTIPRMILPCLRYLLAACLCMLSVLPLAAQGDEGEAAPTRPGLVLVTLKIAKQPTRTALLPYEITFPQDCVRCEVVKDPIYMAENAREIDFALRVPKSGVVSITVDVDPGAVRRILLEGSDLDFKRQPGGVSFVLPAQTTDRPNSAEFQTHIVYRGLDVRFEHADPARRSGKYANGPFPELQRAAAANLEFAQREAVFMLGLDTYVADEQIGTILLMGFDTNDPHGHTDYPPHMHMHMRWPEIGGTQIGHYYIDTKGLLIDNKVGVRGWTGHHIEPFQRGETFTTFDLHARPVYAHTITPEGWLNLGRPGGATCTIRPTAATLGFDQGAVTSCPGFTPVNLRVTDDLQAGLLKVYRNGTLSEVYPYDTDTGLLEPGKIQSSLSPAP
jgi:hypothetical protein